MPLDLRIMILARKNVRKQTSVNILEFGKRGIAKDGTPAALVNHPDIKMKCSNYIQVVEIS